MKYSLFISKLAILTLLLIPFAEHIGYTNPVAKLPLINFIDCTTRKIPSVDLQVRGLNIKAALASNYLLEGLSVFAVTTPQGRLLGLELNSGLFLPLASLESGIKFSFTGITMQTIQFIPGFDPDRGGLFRIGSLYKIGQWRHDDYVIQKRKGRWIFTMPNSNHPIETLYSVLAAHNPYMPWLLSKSGLLSELARDVHSPLAWGEKRVLNRVESASGYHIDFVALNGSHTTKYTVKCER